MKIRLLRSDFGSDDGRHYASSYVVDGRLAIDAGALAFDGSPANQARVRNVLLTHTHADHLSSLPIFLENTCVIGAPRITLWGSSAVLACLHRDVFNGRVWPRIETLSRAGGAPFDLVELEAERPITIDGLRILPIELDHTVPTLGYLVESDAAAVLVVSDTAPTWRIWSIASQVPRLAAVFLEASFPDALSEIAALSKHLTPALFAAEVAKLDRRVAWIAVHIKSRWRDETIRELLALGIDGLEIGVPGTEYEW